MSTDVDLVTPLAASESPDPAYAWAMPRAHLVNFSDEGVLAALRALEPTLDLYAVSMDWRLPHAEIHTLKAKGAYGDVLVRVTGEG